MKAISTGSLNRLCTSCRWSALSRTVCSPWVPLRWMPLCLIYSIMFRPGVDQGDILTSAGEVPTDVAPDCTRSPKDKALAHTTPPLHDHTPAVQAVSYSKLWSGIVAWPPVEHQPQVP